MQSISLGRRLAAAGVDALIVFFGLGFAVAAMLGRTSTSPDGGVEFHLEGTSALLLFALWLAYFVVFEATLGATLGKLLFRVRVRTADGGRIGWLGALIRNLLRITDVCLGLVTLVLMLLTPRRQRLGDFAAGTVVVSCSQA